MNRDIIPMLDNDVLTLIGKEVIKVRDRKTLEWWMRFYTPRRGVCLMEVLYPRDFCVGGGWGDIRLDIRKLENYRIGGSAHRNEWDILRTIEYDSDYELELLMAEEEPLTEEEARLYREGFGSPDSDGAY